MWRRGHHAVRKPKPGHEGSRHGEALRALREGEAGQPCCSSPTWLHPHGDLTPCHTRVRSCPFLQACALAVLVAARSGLYLILIPPPTHLPPIHASHLQRAPGLKMMADLVGDTQSLVPEGPDPWSACLPESQHSPVRSPSPSGKEGQRRAHLLLSEPSLPPCVQPA